MPSQRSTLSASSRRHARPQWSLPTGMPRPMQCPPQSQCDIAQLSRPRPAHGQRRPTISRLCSALQKTCKRSPPEGSLSPFPTSSAVHVPECCITVYHACAHCVLAALPYQTRSPLLLTVLAQHPSILQRDHGTLPAPTSPCPTTNALLAGHDTHHPARTGHGDV